MASKKKNKTANWPRTVLVFSAGLVFPVCLALGWHAAYGQQDSPAPSQPRQHAMVEPSRAAPASAATPSQELSSLEPVFQSMVRRPTLERLDRTIKLWAKSPKVVHLLEERRKRLLELGPAYFDFVRQDVTDQMARTGRRFEESQFFAYADRSPSAQYLLVCLYDRDADRIDILGVDLISSGNVEKGGDYFETPVGVFENLVDNFSYRAQGTPNQEGWRGLGAKDSRVWDFGDQRGVKKYKNGNTLSQMRLLMHSTDPDKGEPRLGRIDSKGCIRISRGLNSFLDSYSILDRNYEEWAKSKPESWLLKKDRKPSVFAGKYLIVGDSSLPLQARNAK